MADRIGIMIPPDVLGMLFRVGAVVTGKDGQGRSFPADQVASGPDNVIDSPVDKRLHYPSPCMM
jgi:hypothetical protein